MSFRDFLNQFVTIYLNDVLVYSNDKKKHEQQMLKMLRKFRKRSFHLNIDKCEFSIFEIKYLEMYVRKNDIKINFEKMKIILN